MKITAVEPSARTPDRWHISLDGAYAFSVDGTLLVSEGLYSGREVTEDEVRRWRQAAEEQRTFDAALAFLAARPRSRTEIRRRLLRPNPKRPSPAPETVERVLARLTEMGLVNDEEFASFWVEQRERFSPRAAYAMTQELRQRGVSAEVATQAADPERDLERALQAGRQRARMLPTDDYAAFRTKLGSFLQRRGFAYGVARDTVRQLWQELGGERNADGDDDEMLDSGDE